MNNRLLARNLGRIKRFLAGKPPPVMFQMSRKANPFQVLVGVLISSRTRDEVTESVCKRLFPNVRGPSDILQFPLRSLERELYPAAFYRNKAVALKKLSADLMERFSGEVPDSIESLTTLKGVGRKTANLTLILAFGQTAICVDTHVHRIVNRWGYVQTDKPDETEAALRKKLAIKYWSPLNEWLVGFGQQVCKPNSPVCSQCPIENCCPRIGVSCYR